MLTSRITNSHVLVCKITTADTILFQQIKIWNSDFVTSLLLLYIRSKNYAFDYYDW